ncbi:pyridoxine/pyridoxamine 5'-phosphate oxidase [Jongsikchunia kroppenstedtii]|uniref:pyridoxine/pyridoxamine 5'-phosphate oxidase n=1 Tax=Jongsikchunia kroppenstedtii TaxID=1121721 RepID=UPI00036CBECA|nr:pyridoxal 5'-phosphate synthase [Jongsikchunia kroppenstedtii]
MTSDWDDDGGRSFLRGLPVLTGARSVAQLDVEAAPDEPRTLFISWLYEAVAADVAEPHAMTISTIDPTGRPRARVLILKAVDAAGWHFAISTESQKGLDLTANPVAALTFYWPSIARQIRVVGPVVDDGAGVSAADFLARPAGSRAMALTLRQSEPFFDPGEIDTALQKARHQLEVDPKLVPHEWKSRAVQPDEVEFWQGSSDRRHSRIQYRRVIDGWEKNLLWP